MSVSPLLPASGPYGGFQDPNSTQGDFNAQSFLVAQLIGKIGTMTPVQVVGTTSSGLVAPPGTVTIVPQINQINGQGAPVPHGNIYNVPIWRMQGGSSAIILDPAVGDLGMAFIAMRDISVFKATGKQSNPGSFRRYSLADSIYIGSILGATPSQYIQFLPGGGINVVSPGTVTVTAPTIALVGNVTASATVIAQGDVTGASISLHTHVHGGVQSGSSNTGEPV